MTLNGRTQSAHRAVWALLVGPLDPGITLDHMCRFHPCVNPAHLEPVTGGENARRMHYARSGRIRRQEDKPKHPKLPPRPIPAPTDAAILDFVAAILVDSGRMHTVDILERLAALEPVAYGAWGPEQLAAALRPHGVNPTQISIAGRNRKGYRIEPIRDALKRWERRAAG